jgi:hypothetical protein
MIPYTVIPAKAGIWGQEVSAGPHETPAFGPHQSNTLMGVPFAGATEMPS